MKRILLASALALAAAAAAAPARAADFPPGPPAAPPAYGPAVEVYDWTGFYFGVNGGWAFGTSNWTFVPGTAATGDFDANGFLIGATLGANYQSGAIVFGVEADGDWTDLDGTAGVCSPACETKSDWLATLRGRMGYAWDRILVYATAGAAFANVQAGFSGGPFGSATQIGWTAGLGIEAAFAPNWTARVEYLFVDLADASCTAACDPSFGTTTSVALTENIVRAGVDYKFHW